jgi:hypothetical protein
MCDPRTEAIMGTETPRDWENRDTADTPEGRPVVDVLRWPGPRRPAPGMDPQRWLDLCG